MNNNQQTERLDPLLGCLGILCKLEELPFSEQAAIAGLPVEKHGISPSSFLRAAKRMGFAAHVNKRKLSQLNNLVLPAILILNDNQACVINKIHDDGKADVYFPENPEDYRTVQISELNDQFTGYVIFATASHEFEQRAEQLFKPTSKSWFWGTVFSYKKIFAHVLIAAFISNLFVLVIPVYIMNVYDRVIPNQAIDTLWVLTIGAIIFFAFDFVARVLRSYLVDIAGRRADFVLSSELFQRLLNLKMRHKPVSSGAFSSYFNEFEILREFFTSASLVAIIDLPFIALFLLVMWFIGGSIIIIPLIAIPIVVAAAVLMEWPMKNAMKNALAGSTQKNAILVETINSLETVKSLGAEGIMQKHWEDSVASQSSANIKSRTLANLSLNITLWAQQLVIIGIIAYGVFLVDANQITVGGLIACTILAGRVMMLGPFVNLATRISRSAESLKALNKIMELPYERDPEHKYLHRPFLRGDIKFENVTFVYPRRRAPALNNASIDISAGEKVGIIGKIGAGKSTIMRLITNLYQPSSGTVMLDGTDCNEIDPADLRTNCRYVASDSNLFYGTIKENIQMGNYFADDDDILKAAKMAGVDDFVSQSPLGYDMPVGELGQALSAGQRQAVILARALVSDAPIILLDEPTSAVDSSYEKEFVKNTRSHFQGKTLILATHRYSMLELVDRLIVIDQGQIVADGPKEEVIEALNKKQIMVGQKTVKKPKKPKE